MEIKSVFDEEFKTYGRVVSDYDFAELLKTLEEVSPKPMDSVVYVPGDEKLECLPIYETLKNNVYGGMPIQIGYCNGFNTKLNCYEYHRDSEIDIAADDCILLVARQQEIVDGKIDASCTKAFKCPKGVGVELYATTLHYAPCSAAKDQGFRVIIVLPKGTNLDKPAIKEINPEDKYLWAANKWLLAHADSAEAKDGAQVSITGENVDIIDLL
ncbi:MAG: DUF4867 family protein [Lachnospiraceae bacterium]|nr:DUF4867 family protein [Lachnospiraceae bacterium]